MIREHQATDTAALRGPVCENSPARVGAKYYFGTFEAASPGYHPPLQSTWNCPGFRKQMESYLSRYPPLANPHREFRLLKLSQNQGEDSLIHFELTTVSVETPPKYYALSYTWCHDQPRYLICVNKVYCPVRRNLYDFIAHVVCQRYHDCFFFVDAVCINQLDEREKESQIALMGKIYSTAMKVVVWLGGLEWREEEAVQSGKTILLDIAARQSSNSNSGKGQMSWRTSTLFCSLLHHQFWSRVWIIQEVILAKEVVIHTRQSTLSFEDVASALSAARIVNPGRGVDWTTHGASEYHRGQFKSAATVSGSTFSYKANIIDAWRRERHQKPSPRLYQCMIAFAGQSCHHRKDQIFGLLGLAQDNTCIRADYRVTETDLFLFTLLEGFFDIVEEDENAALRTMLFFYGTCLTAFNLSPFHPTVHLIVRSALDLALSTCPSNITVSDSTFALFWGEVFSRRPHPLRSTAWPVVKLFSIQAALRGLLIISFIPRTWATVYKTLTYLTANLHYMPQKLLLLWMRQVDCLMPMTNTERVSAGTQKLDLEVHTYTEWVARVDEVARLVKARTPPVRPDTPLPSKEILNEAHRTWLPRKGRLVREETAKLLDIWLTILLSVLLVWLGVHIGRWLDALCAMAVDYTSAEFLGMMGISRSTFRRGSWALCLTTWPIYSLQQRLTRART